MLKLFVPVQGVDFKEDFWAEIAMNWYTTNKAILTILALSYIPVIFGIKYYMRNREPFQLKVPLAVWNLGLCIFSVLGSIIAVPVLWKHAGFGARPFFGPDGALCDASCFTQPGLIWIFYFNVSKFYELVDTVLIVLRKKPLIFLHWYHHIMTLCFCWYANQWGYKLNCTGPLFASMNLLVHSIMYFYYFWSAIRRPPRWALFLTAIQIIQMIGGITIVWGSIQCELIDYTSVYFSCIMYASYFILFFKLFLDKYVWPKPRKAAAAADGSRAKKKN